MAMNRPAIAGMKYWSAADCGISTGAVVTDTTSLAWNEVSADDGRSPR
jgi:hypothetical protein